MAQDGVTEIITDSQCTFTMLFNSIHSFNTYNTPAQLVNGRDGICNGQSGSTPLILSFVLFCLYIGGSQEMLILCYSLSFKTYGILEYVDIFC